MRIPLLLVLLATGAAIAAEIPLPATGVLINVRNAPYSAKGDGIADDTAAIQAAVTAALQPDRNYWTTAPIVYLPRGTYRVTGSILGKVGPGDGDWRCGMFLFGESRTGTVIRLDANAPGFGDATAPKPLIRTASDHSAGSGPAATSTDGRGNRAFRNHLFNLTIEVGAGNPGCQAIDYLANNRGAIEEVTIRAAAGSGHTGIAMNRSWPGPALISRVRIEGFAYALTMFNHYEYQMTAEHLEIVGPRTAAVAMTHNQLAMRKVTYTGTAPFLTATSNIGLVVLHDSTLTANGTTSGAAIRTAKKTQLRDVRCTGWSTVVDDQTAANRDVAGTAGATTTIPFWTAGSTAIVNDETLAPLRLPVEEVPDVAWPTVDQWTVLQGGGDLVAALAGTKPGILLNPRNSTYNGYFYLKQPIRVGPGSAIRRIMGTTATFRFDGAYPTTETAVQFSGSAGQVLVLENLSISKGIRHSGAGTLILRHCSISGGIVADGPGRTFIVDCIGKGFDIRPGHRLWARQLNSEFGDVPLHTTSGRCWIFGYKTEGQMTEWFNDGGEVEIIGAMCRPLAVPATSTPAWVNRGGQMDVSYAMGMSSNEQYPWTLQFREIEGAATRDLLRSTLGNSGQAILVSRTNRAPVVSAGPDRTITLPASASLDGTVSDDRLPLPTGLTQQWTKVSGPGTVTFAAAAAVDTTATFSVAGTYVLRLTASDGALTTSDDMTVTAQASTLPAGWSTAVVGNASPAGSTAYSGGMWTIAGSGADIWGTADAFRFAWRPIAGDLQITVKVTSQTNTNGWAKAGLMIRESTAAGSRHASLFATPTAGVSFQRRATTNGSAVSTAGPKTPAPVWLRLERVGATITAFSSVDGVAWTRIGQADIAVGTTPLVGLAVTSHAAGTLSTATFTDLVVVTLPVGAG